MELDFSSRIHQIGTVFLRFISLTYWQTFCAFPLGITQGSQWCTICASDALEPKFTLFKFVLWNWPSKLASEGCLLSKVLNYVSAWKSGNSFPLIRHRYHSCDLGKSSMLSAQFYTLCIQALWSDENYNIVRSRVQSKSKYYIQNKILSLHSWLVKGWQLVIQSDNKLMKRGWKYPLKHQEGGEGTPLKDSKLGALCFNSFGPVG